ncbi:MAG: DNA-directed RNA polymerase subunit H [Candidatus Huberarchaeum crystalense]|uniref:DNA-directed RNA polymerase subunit H n=2 Tax=Huberarchaeum crystalense TaxID=2014257 RepID=A0A2G9LJC8_HUBC1|nr:DNA-directed RNA polymerase subunit H [archaeon]OIP20816.1 MAG: hypothetical protein AUJ91_00375 [archaeon CG2_30_31_98]PIN66668.1 MAG: DNA-directed RNA polymerase subunit H [Candidatus Huberarchaeum crystalense]NCS98239.1 DNA-directed RNA polymerase subunit H [archaeon]PIV13698.1 MAG: DNA-directed RNA polymerase subunit H [Candidatus Huberarchaeum crystalense]
MSALSTNKKTEPGVLEHYLVPDHKIITSEEARKIFEFYSISFENLPKIDITDPVIKAIKGKPGDIIKITRKNGKIYYRGVV